MLYGIKNPFGSMEDFCAQTKGECWDHVWDLMSQDFHQKYWKRMDASIKAYRRMGYKVVKVKITEVV